MISPDPSMGRLRKFLYSFGKRPRLKGPEISVNVSEKMWKRIKEAKKGKR